MTEIATISIETYNMMLKASWEGKEKSIKYEELVCNLIDLIMKEKEHQLERPIDELVIEPYWIRIEDVANLIGLNWKKHVETFKRDREEFVKNAKLEG